MVRFRGHHLICLHFFKGEGYNREFVENLLRALKDAERTGVEVVDGADDVCATCPHNSSGVCAYSSTADAEIRELDKLALNLLSISPGSKVSWSEIRAKIPEIMDVWRQKACTTCDWRNVCHAERSNHRVGSSKHNSKASNNPRDY
ncbi:DUF1284 domain-containing protein [Archaeoglobus veneficus]|uniref:DUF1284 domain-containing protein n=1 Tax=Archaeoglobus veneficus (strain DSM 11195 / SNP6) TaxID=693661 RepID=F2KNJ4_ARCVS|nr:DUF1284 domain-containing protein [Archaeoglobus veneficus]AEA46222.1 protein of unknown function DUF1284 [Archaeoglobus veneficus SNP6]